MIIHQLAQFVRPMTDHDRNAILFWLGILMVIVVVGFALIMLIRRKLKADQAADSESDGGFLLSDLRKMRDRGEITPEEYEMTRAKVVAKVKANAANVKMPKPKENPNPPPNLQDPEPQ